MHESRTFVITVATEPDEDGQYSARATFNDEFVAVAYSQDRAEALRRLKAKLEAIERLRQSEPELLEWTPTMDVTAHSESERA